MMDDKSVNYYYACSSSTNSNKEFCTSDIVRKTALDVENNLIMVNLSVKSYNYFTWHHHFY